MSRTTNPRMRRVNAILLEVIAGEVAELKDPRIGFVTVTGVDTSPDLRRAIVYFSVLGSEEEQAATREALRSAATHVQTEVGHKVRLKYTPRLEFRVDESIQQGVHMSQLLRELGAGDEDEHG